jgi:hypothetical protein
VRVGRDVKAELAAHIQHPGVARNKSIARTSGKSATSCNGLTKNSAIAHPSTAALTIDASVVAIAVVTGVKRSDWYARNRRTVES